MVSGGSNRKVLTGETQLVLTSMSLLYSAKTQIPSTDPSTSFIKVFNPQNNPMAVGGGHHFHLPSPHFTDGETENKKVSSRAEV